MRARCPNRSLFALLLEDPARCVLVCVAGLLGLLVPSSVPAFAQVFQMTGGSSSLLNAEGGSFEVHGGDYTGRVDLGYIGQASLGFFFARPFTNSLLGSGELGAGDQQIPFLLPTDLFDHSFYFLGRGLSLAEKPADGRLFIFAGVTSNGYSAPFLNIARADTPAGAIFYERQLTSFGPVFSHATFFPTGKLRSRPSSGRHGRKIAQSGALRGHW